MIELKKIRRDEKAGSTALQELNLQIADRGITVLLGDGGSGKDTLLRILGGLDRPDSGEVLFRGQPRKETTAERESWRGSAAGFVNSGRGLLEGESVFANVELAMRLTGMEKTARRRRASQLIKRVGLSEKANTVPEKLDHFELVCADIARALANDPEMLLLSEPLERLNREESELLLGLLRAVAKDRPVILTAREEWLGEESDLRCVRMLGGHILSDSDPCEAEESGPVLRMAHPILGLGDAWRFMRKGDTRRRMGRIASAVTVALAMALLGTAFALPRGWEAMERDMESDALSVLPVTIRQRELDEDSLLKVLESSTLPGDHIRDAVYSPELKPSWQEAVGSFNGKNDLNALLAALREDEKMSKTLSALQYDDGTELHIYASDTSLELRELSPCPLEKVWGELPGSRETLERQYDVIAGRWSTSYDELVLFVDENNELDDVRMEALGLLNWESSRSNYEKILSTTYRLLKPTDYFQSGADGRWARIDGDTDLLHTAVDGGMVLHVVGIVRPSPSASEHCFSCAMGYTTDLVRHVSESVEKSAAVTQQRAEPGTDIFTALPFMPDSLRGLDAFGKTAALRSALNELGVAEKMAMYSELTGASQADAAAMVSAGTLDAALEEQVQSRGESRCAELCEKYILSAYSEGRYEDNLSMLGANGGTVAEMRLYTSSFADRSDLLNWLESYNRSAVRDGRLAETVEWEDNTDTLIRSARAGGKLLTLVLTAAAALSLLVTALALRARMNSTAQEMRGVFSTLALWGVGDRDASLVLRMEALLSCLLGGAAGVGLSVVLCAVMNQASERFWGMPLHLTLSWKDALLLPTAAVLLSLLSTLDGGKQMNRIKRF